MHGPVGEVDSDGESDSDKWRELKVFQLLESVVFTTQPISALLHWPS